MGIPPGLFANRYRPLRPLGQGGQGAVFAAEDTHEGDTVALKLLSHTPPGGVWHEAQILRRLADPHILPIRNADVWMGQPYLVTDLAEHGTLADELRAGGSCGVPIDDVVRWTRHACYGTARAHDRQLLHNDLKPGNLFLNAQRESLVGDFGFASVITPGTTASSPPGATAETASPEIAASWPTPTATVASDVYSLGATAFWLLAGRPPHDFTGAADVQAKMAIVAAQSPARLRDLAPHVPQHLASVIERALDRVPSNRYASATEFAAALGTRRAQSRRWRRTDEHPGHLACWRGEPAGTGNTYVLCLEQGVRPTQAVITATQAGSGRRINTGCRSVPMRTAAQGVRAAMRALS